MARIGIDIRKWFDFGIGQYLRELLRELLAQDSANRYFLFARPAECSRIPLMSRHQEVLPEESPPYSLRELGALRRWVKRLHLDLLHVPHYTLPFGLRSRAVVTLHDLIHLSLPTSTVRQLYARIMIGHAARASARIIVPSEATREELTRRFPAAAARVRVVPHGVPHRFTAGAESLSSPLPQLPPDYMLFVGNERPYKNLFRVLEAYARLKEEYGGALVLVGLPLPPHQSLRRMVRQLRIEERVHFTGYLTDEVMPEVYRRARLLLAPSLIEGFGFPALEAMAVGTPVVTSRHGAASEVAGEAALLVNPLLVEEITEAARRLLREDDLARELARRGRERACLFSWRETAAGTLAVYQEILSGSDRVVIPIRGNKGAA